LSCRAPTIPSLPDRPFDAQLDQVVDAAEETEIARPKAAVEPLKLPVAVDGHKADAAFCSCDPLLDRLTDVEHFADEEYCLYLC
jgi:hypothetical protein